MTDNDKLQIIINHDEYTAKLTDRLLSERQLFTKQILIICTTLLGILISLKSGKIINECELISFIMVIGTLGLSILLGVILLYENINTLGSAIKATSSRKDKLLAGKKEDSTLISVPSDKFYDKIRIVYFASFGLSIVSIVVYALISFS